MRLIDADKLAKEIADSINDASIQNDELSLSILRVFKKTVDDEPTIDAEPVKRGRWVTDENLVFAKCSSCQAVFYLEDLEQVGDDDGIVHFCPLCGARMDGDADEKP